MEIFELAIALLLGGALLALLANRIAVPYPALLALAGTVIALLPGTPEITLDPELALALFVAPILLDAAYDASPRDLRDNLVPVLNLALFAVGATIVAVAVVARLVIPDMGWATAIALGAIVAPPDASAATAVLRRLSPPHRILILLEGESLFNDATALIVYRIAVVAAITGTFSPWNVMLMLVLIGVGSLIAGIGLARAYLWLTSRVEDVPVWVLLQFIGTFAVWLIAERVGLSPIIAVVSYAMTLARRAPARMDARRRIVSYAVWEVVVFVLNVLAFLLIGLQISGILDRTHATDMGAYLMSVAAVCATVVIVRPVWWMPWNAFVRWRIRRYGPRVRRPTMLPSAGSGLVISWAGMRGIVTLAAALALPPDMPHRDFILLAAFGVVLSTLVLQGLTLGPLMNRVCLHPDDSVDREISLARVETARAALRALEDADDGRAAEILRAEYEARMQSGKRGSAATSENPETSSLARLQGVAVAAQRRELFNLRERGVIGDDAFHALEEELDVLELTADARIRPDVMRGE